MLQIKYKRNSDWGCKVARLSSQLGELVTGVQISAAPYYVVNGDECDEICLCICANKGTIERHADREGFKGACRCP